MSLAFFEQKLHNVEVQLRRLRQSNPIRWWRTWRGFAHTQRGLTADGDELGDRRVAVQDSDRFTAANGAEVLTQPRFQVGNPDLLHGHIVTINSHERKRRFEVAQTY